MSNKLSSIDVSELICTRISHDLIGNIGAVSNAVELLEEDDAESFADVKPILELSSKVLLSRLKFFRLAFGLSNASVKNAEELKIIAENYVQTIGNRNYPIKLALKVNTLELYKIVLLGIMTLADMFIKGGFIEAVETTSGITFVAKTDYNLSLPKLEAVKTVLSNNIPEENPAQIAPMVYLKGLLKATGINITLDFSEQKAVLQIG